MVGRALSERVKRQLSRRIKNTQMQMAIDEYRREQAKPEGVRKLGYRPIAAKHGVSSSTLQALVNGGVSMSAFNATKQKLTHAEERVLVDFILESSDRAAPLSLKNIAVHANGILEGREEPGQPVGDSWVPRFLDRYRDELQTHWSRPLATERARSLNKDAVKHWFELIKEKVIDKGIKEHNIYGMDESGFPPSNQGVQRVVGRRGTKVQHKAGSANRENVTVLVTICADGTALQPTVIFKGKKLLKKWGNNNVSNASLSATENGWTDGGLALDWMMKDFDRQTKEKAAGETRVLFMDGHSSHFTADLLEYCLANNIEVYGYPPHCTHALQGLDVVCFAKMKECWKEAIDEHEKLHHHGVNKEDFLEVWGGAFLEAFTEENIRSAFRKTGIWPYNADVISAEQMKPAEATSTRSTFPLPQTSPVRAVMAAFNHYEFTEAGLHPNSPPRAGPSTFPGSHYNQPEPQLDAAHTSGTEHNPRKRQIDPASNPDLATPSKRMRFLGVGLANTSSGSFLVKKTRVTHLQMKGIIQKPVIEHIPDELPMPDWNLLHSEAELPSYTRSELEGRCRALVEALGHAKNRITAAEEIMSGQSGQLIVQNMGMEALNRTLFQKEQPKANDRAAMFPKGFGRHATDPEWIQQKRTLEDEAKQKEVDKAQRKVRKASKKARKVELEERWKAVCVAHEEAVVSWKARCEVLREGGTAAKNLPKKPKRVLKASLVEEDEDANEGGGSDEASDSDDE